MTIGEKIREARKSKKLTQKELGEKLGVTPSMISQYEKGKRNPKINTLISIACALDFPIDANMFNYQFQKGTPLRASAEVFQLEYIVNPKFVKAVRASILSAIRDTEHSCTDEKLAENIADRMFGIEQEGEKQ